MAGDHKATNGAITAAGKALELVARLRGELQAGSNVNVQVSAQATAALGVQSEAEGMRSGDVTEQAASWLRAQLEAGDRDAMRIVLELMRMLPSAEASTQPQGVTGELAPEPERIIPEPTPEP